MSAHLLHNFTATACHKQRCRLLYLYSCRLTDLQGTLQQCGHQIQQLPLTAVMLWGVVAVEFQEAETARATLGAYLAATQGRPEGALHMHGMQLFLQLHDALAFICGSSS
jgi:hypothetical protein